MEDKLAEFKKLWIEGRELIGWSDMGGTHEEVFNTMIKNIMEIEDDLEGYLDESINRLTKFIEMNTHTFVVIPEPNENPDRGAWSK